MPAYPSSDMEAFQRLILAANPTFERFVGVTPRFEQLQQSGLYPLINLLKTNSTTADAIVNAYSALYETVVERYKTALNYVLWTYPGLPTSAAAVQAVRGLAADPNSSAQALQTQLDLLSYHSALHCDLALQLLVRVRNDVEYIGLASFEPAFNGPNGAIVAGPQVSYTTKHFNAKAKCYAVTPAAMLYDIGFIQICLNRSYHIRYRDDNINVRWDAAGGFPASDTLNASHAPFYYVGLGRQRTFKTAYRQKALHGFKRFELDDNFNNCTASTELYYQSSVGGHPPVNTSTQILSLTRTQNFKAWLAVKRSTSLTYRLLNEVTYGFDFDIDFSAASPPVPTFNDRPQNIIPSIPVAGATLPGAALNGTGLNGADNENVYIGNVFKGPISAPISVP